MASIEDILAKSKARKKPYQPTQRRAWDFVVDTNENNNGIQQEDTTKEEQIKEQTRNVKGDNGERISEQRQNKTRNKQEQKQEQFRNNKKDENKDKLHTSSIEQNIKTTRDLVPITAEKLDLETQLRIVETLRKTTGHQSNIMGQFTAHIKSSKSIENTIRFSISTLSSRLKIDKETIRTSLKRLDKKGIISKAEGIRGRHGSTQISIPDFIIKECLNLFDCEPLSLDDIRDWKRDKNRDMTNTNSSSYINIITTNNNNLSENWKTVNVEPLAHIGFSITQLKQLSSKSLNSPEIVQESINHFAFGLKNNPKFKQYNEPLNVLMGVLRKGELWVEANYKSPQEEAQEKLLEVRKAEKERLEKLEKDAYNLAFKEWSNKLDEPEIERITTDGRKNDDITPKEVRLRIYFSENCWDKVKKDYLLP